MKAILIIGLIMVMISLIRGDCPDTFSYNDQDANGPSHWSTLCDEWKVCGEGDRQSPINILLNENTTLAHKGVYSRLSLDTETNINSNMYNNEGSHVIGIRIPEDSIPLWGGKIEDNKYYLEDVKIRTPSEHLIDGVRHEAEIQFYFKSEGSDELKAIAVLVNANGVTKNEFLQRLIETVVPKIGETSGEFRANLENVFPIDMNYYTYEGSLTAPPCTENVQWYVLNKPIVSTFAQINHFSNDFPYGNARPTQNYAKQIFRFQDNSIPLQLIVTILFSVMAVGVIIFVVITAIIAKFLYKPTFTPGETKKLLIDEQDEEESAFASGASSYQDNGI